MSLLLKICPLALTLGAAVDLDARHPGGAAFVAEVSQRHGLAADAVSELLAGAERRQEIIDAITRPAEAKPWRDYRPIFVTPERIRDGIAFWAENHELLQRVEAEFGVPPQVVVAIIGVETNYGRITGRFRVLDALATLAFHYPPRSKFFRSELEHFLLLGQEESLPLDELTGSYAGAMGLGQFISSSYRSYAVDFDQDGQRDLWGSRADAIASVANYFRRHGWRPGQPVASPATRAEGARELTDLPLKPSYPLSQIVAWGYRPSQPGDEHDLATVIELEGDQGPEFWIGFHNFYVISRYNPSALYSLAVHQLSEELAARTVAAAGAEEDQGP